MTFNEFIDHKNRDAIKHLNTIKKLLESQDVKVSSHLNEVDPYIFVHNTGDRLSFQGIRIYQIGSQLAYRIQKEEKTHPFGKAYSLNLEEMYEDLLEDHPEPEKAGKALIKSVVDEVKKFFEKNVIAEKELQSQSVGMGNNNQYGAILIRNNPLDYGNMRG